MFPVMQEQFVLRNGDFMSEADKKRKARKKAEKKAHVEGVKATGEAVPANVAGTSISPTNTTGTPVEMPLEAELTEELDPAEKFAKEALEAVEEAPALEEREPEETPLEAEPEPSEISVAEAKRAAAEVELARLKKLAEVAKLQARLRELGVK